MAFQAVGDPKRFNKKHEKNDKRMLLSPLTSSASIIPTRGLAIPSVIVPPLCHQQADATADSTHQFWYAQALVLIPQVELRPL